ncbi:MAG: hypothetical protein QOF15_4317, partial [Mycobacterium sp.]|nr:hypothetical protein [Mycobacterium sp.]
TSCQPIAAARSFSHCGRVRRATDTGPTDVYADLFDDDLTAVANKLDESVGKLWAQRPVAIPQQS